MKNQNGVIKRERKCKSDSFDRQSEAFKQEHISMFIKTRILRVSLVKKRQGMSTDARMQEKASSDGTTDYHKGRKCGPSVPAAEENRDAADHQRGGEFNI